LEKIKEFIQTLEYDNSLFLEEKIKSDLEITKLQIELKEMSISRLRVVDMPVDGLGGKNDVPVRGLGVDVDVPVSGLGGVKIDVTISGLEGNDSDGTVLDQEFESHQRLFIEVENLHKELQEKKKYLEFKEVELSNVHSIIENYEDEILIYKEENKELRLLIEGDVYSTIQNLEKQLLISTYKCQELNTCHQALIHFHIWINDKKKTHIRIPEYSDIISTDTEVPVSTDTNHNNNHLKNYEIFNVNLNHAKTETENENLLPLIEDIRKITEEVIYNQEKEYREIMVTKESLRIMLSKEQLNSTEINNVDHSNVLGVDNLITPIKNYKSGDLIIANNAASTINGPDNASSTVVVFNSG
jgi:hypothetical protein